MSILYLSGHSLEEARKIIQIPYGDAYSREGKEETLLKAYSGEGMKEALLEEETLLETYSRGGKARMLDQILTRDIHPSSSLSPPPPPPPTHTSLEQIPRRGLASMLPFQLISF